MPKNQRHENCKFIISRLLRGKIDWGKEIRLAKFLVDAYPNMKFWEQLTLDTYPTSLSILCSPSGRKFLKEEHNAFVITHTPEIKMEEKPVVKIKKEDPKKRKPKTLMEFIDSNL